jgi:cation diffusion facilitator CzcD-associated flavoprotein CzcO
MMTGTIMAIKKQEVNVHGIFQNTAEFFEQFRGKIIPSHDIKQTDFKDKKVAIIGADQHTVTHLELISQSAQFIKVFQITPHFVLPNTERGLQRLINHPLVIKNRRLFNSRVKSLLALRYLDSQVQDAWTRRQLTPNVAAANKVFLKSDSYYTALQKENCKLITWPVVKISADAVQSMEGIEHLVDIIITTY